MSTSESSAGRAETDDIVAQLKKLQADLDQLKNTLKDAGKREAQSAVSSVEAYARDNPRAVIAGAVGVGLLLGLMLRGRR